MIQYFFLCPFTSPSFLFSSHRKVLPPPLEYSPTPDSISHPVPPHSSFYFPAPFPPSLQFSFTGCALGREPEESIDWTSAEALPPAKLLLVLTQVTGGLNVVMCGWIIALVRWMWCIWQKCFEAPQNSSLDTRFRICLNSAPDDQHHASRPGARLPMTGCQCLLASTTTAQ